MGKPNAEPNEDKLQDVQDKIDRARDRARAHGMVSDADEKRGPAQRERDEYRDEEEQAIDGLTRPGLG
jgi:hypothetical protein